MPEIAWTLDLGDVVIGVVGLVLLPTARMTIKAMSSIRRAVEDLTVTMYGTTTDASIGILSRVGDLKKQTQRHHERLVEVEMELGVKRERP